MKTKEINKKTEKIYNQLNDLKQEALSIMTGLISTKYNGERVDFDEDNQFEDSANNNIVAVDENGVYFDDFGGSEESYSIQELDIYDVLHIISLLS